MLLWKIKAFDDGHQCLTNRVSRLTAEYCRHFVAPPVERGARHIGIRTFIHHIIHLAAEGIQHGHGLPSVWGEEAEAAGETGAALFRLVYAVLVRVHRIQRGADFASMITQSNGRNTGRLLNTS